MVLIEENDYQVSYYIFSTVSSLQVEHYKIL